MGPQVFDGDQNVVAPAAHNASFEAGSSARIDRRQTHLTHKAALWARAQPQQPGSSLLAEGWIESGQLRPIELCRKYVTAHILREMPSRVCRSARSVVEGAALLANVVFESTGG